MMSVRLAIPIVLALAAGCSTGSDSYSRPTPTQAAASAKPAVEPPEWMKVRDYRDGGPVPPMEANRKINEQACTQGVETTAGNLRCK